MSFITQPKTEGEKMDCPNCNAPLLSRLKEYKDYENKIQWQDVNQTKAHFDKNGNCKGKEETISNEIELNSKNLDIASTPRTEVFGIEKLDKIDIQLDKLIEIESIVTKKLTINNTPPNPAKVGMYMKFVYDSLEKQNWW